jgi:uncharacterized protein DUF4386
MSPITKNPGRSIGLLYLLVTILGIFALLYVPRKLIVHGDATATAGNIAAHGTLFRAGIACNLVSEILFAAVVLALHDLFKRINQRQAAIMLALTAVALPIAMLNELNAIAALILGRDADFLTVPRRASWQ